MLNLDRITLVCVTSVDFIGHINALLKSMEKIKFARAVFVSDRKPDLLPDFIDWEDCGEKLDYDGFSKYMLYNLTDHVHTDFCLTIHADGYVLRPDLWTDEFLNYDYIGAPWPLLYTAFIDPFDNHIRVGNGGFSLRSKRLLDVPKNIDIPFDVNKNDFYRHMGWNAFSEDANICVHNRHLYQLMGCKFSPVSLAARFSTEAEVPESVESFGYHKFLPAWAE